MIEKGSETFFDMASTNSDNVEKDLSQISALTDSVKQMDVAGGDQEKKEVRFHF